MVRVRVVRGLVQGQVPRAKGQGVKVQRAKVRSIDRARGQELRVKSQESKVKVHGIKD